MLPGFLIIRNAGRYEKSKSTGFLMKNHPHTKRLKVINQKRYNELYDDILFWQKRSPEERLNTVEFLREQIYLISGNKSIPRFIYEIKIER